MGDENRMYDSHGCEVFKVVLSSFSSLRNQGY